MKELFKNMGPAGQLAIFLLLIVLGLIAAGILTLVITGTATEKKDTLIYVQGLSQIAMFLLPSLVFAWLFHDKAGSFFQTKVQKWQWASVIVAVAIMITAIPMVDYLTTWNENMHMPESLGKWEEEMRKSQALSQELLNGFLSRPGIGNMIVNLTVLAAIPAVCEEFVFRGVVQKTLVGWFRNPHVAIATTAAVFSLTHFEPFYFVPRFVLGIVLGYIFYHTRTIWASALAHFTNNALIVLLTYGHNAGLFSADPQNIQLPYPAAFAIGSLLVTILLLIFITIIGKKNAQKSPKNKTAQNDTLMASTN